MLDCAKIQDIYLAVTVDVCHELFSQLLENWPVRRYGGGLIAEPKAKVGLVADSVTSPTKTTTNSPSATRRGEKYFVSMISP